MSWEQLDERLRTAARTYRRLGNQSAESMFLESADSITELQAENAKLRGLLRDLWQFTGAACKRYPRLFDPSAQGGQMVQLNAIEAFEQRMRELGIEVEDDRR